VLLQYLQMVKIFFRSIFLAIRIETNVFPLKNVYMTYFFAHL